MKNNMIKKYSIALLSLIITLLIIFYVTYFNQQRYYDIQEKNRINGFELLLKAKSETNKVCLKYATQDECYENFVKSLEQLNPRGSVQLANSQNQIVKIWDNERHKDDRENISISKTFTEFDNKPVVTLSKLTRHQNLYKSSFNAMFFSVLDYSKELRARIKGLPSTFGEMTPYAFTKYVAWGRFYPVLPIWIIAAGLLGYIISLLFKNLSFTQSIKDLQKEIQKKELSLKQMDSESESIKHSYDQLHLETIKKLDMLNQEKEEYSKKADALELELSSLQQDKNTLVNKISSIELQDQKNSLDKENLRNSLMAQKKILADLDTKNQSLKNDISVQISEKNISLKEYEAAKTELASLENLYIASKEKENELSEKLNSLNDQMHNLNDQFTSSETDKNLMINHVAEKEIELNEYLEHILSIEMQFKEQIESKNHEVELLKSGLMHLQTDKENLQHELDKLSGGDTASRKIYNVLTNNPDMPKSSNYEYSEPEHHSKAYVKSIQNSFKNQKNYKIGNLITDLRGTKFNSKTPNTLRIVHNYAVSPDITRSGFGLVSVEKDHGYAAYIHLTARNPSEAILAAKAIQNYCSVFKGYRIIPLND